MSQRLAWGILGTGNIAAQFARGLTGARRGTVVAVGSRSRDSADTFARTFAIPAGYASYDALLDDDAVQAVYISLPNSLHYEWTLKALDAGKHVLCEKPAAVTLEQAREMFDRADSRGLVLVEAFMYRSHPQTHALLDVVRSGAIGQLRLVRTSFCFRVKKTQGNIRFDAALAGGSLMDIGCYCLDFTRLVTGEEPTSLHAIGHLHESGVDDYAAGVLAFPSGVLGSFACGMSLQADNNAHLCGTEGHITIPWPWKPVGDKARFTIEGMTPPRQDNEKQGPPPVQIKKAPADRPLYALEADDFAATVLEGAAPTVTAESTLANTRCLVELRRQLGLSF